MDEQDEQVPLKLGQQYKRVRDPASFGNKPSRIASPIETPVSNDKVPPLSPSARKMRDQAMKTANKPLVRPLTKPLVKPLDIPLKPKARRRGRIK